MESNECSGNSDLGDVNIKRDIFQRDSLSHLVLILALIPVSLILKKPRQHEFSGSKVKINHFLFIDDLNLYSRNEKGLDSLVQIMSVLVKIRNEVRCNLVKIRNEVRCRKVC